eukprot:CAMPEP_0113670354 /NCGR_PEP_ID=MMETSP0038_2-20120614/5091_1 /TAXON_ID=2898 /ORGANISM="Cryptomonas paramecium" /LENGTH=143 /DNA_ID=CAMNT_0000586363 /DNA_START=182 /DNA_END=609 /DNA_ORIENTATION=- /assembly_acc=CAM_ASM_000170
MNQTSPSHRSTAIDPSNANIIIGTIVAIVGNILISLSYQIQKLVHRANADGKRSYLSFPLWWLGFLLIVVGEVGNFLAYGWAPATLVAPLGAISVVSNCILARIIVKEPLSHRSAAGVTLALLGAAVVAYSAPTSQSEDAAAA